MPSVGNSFYLDEPEGMAYFTFLTEELPDYLEHIFPLSKKREETFIGGLSMGGYGAIQNGLKYSDVFGHIIGCSPAMIIGDLNKDNLIATVTGATKSYYRTVFGNDLDAAD